MQFLQSYDIFRIGKDRKIKILKLFHNKWA